MRMFDIPQLFAETHKGERVEENEFNYAVTIDGRFVCSWRAMGEFPEHFAALQATGWEPDIINLYLDDFPQPDLSLPE